MLAQFLVAGLVTVTAQAPKNETSATALRVVVGGSLKSDSPILSVFKEAAARGTVRFITAAGLAPLQDAREIESFFAEAGISAEWIDVHSYNCDEHALDPEYANLVTSASAIYSGCDYYPFYSPYLDGPFFTPMSHE